MADKNSQVAASLAAGASGRGPATEPAPIDVFSEAWHIIEKGILASPTFDVTIKARHSIVVSDRDVEVEIDHFGLSIRVRDEELIIDPRYNVAELRKRGELVAISDKVKYRWIHGPEYEKIYEAKDFANLIKKSVKELIEEAINLTTFDVV
jgi:hypothetical protein